MVPIDVEPGFNAAVQALVKVEPPAANQRVLVPMDESQPLDLNTLLANGTFFEYAGSLTAPPCAEIVTWLVRREPVTASGEQLRRLTDSVLAITAGFGNARSAMPLNGRTVAVRQALQEPPRLTSGDPDGMPESVPMPDREHRAMAVARDALRVAESSVEYVKDLDARLRATAEAHALALAPHPNATHAPVAAHESAAANATAVHAADPRPVATTTPGPDALEALARAMAASVQQAAGTAMAGAAEQLTAAARAAAMAAAKDATAAVLGTLASTSAHPP